MHIKSMAIIRLEIFMQIKNWTELQKKKKMETETKIWFSSIIIICRLEFEIVISHITCAFQINFCMFK